MLSKCANPTCFARFRYLNEGRIFNVEMGAAVSGPARPSYRIEHFWLCADCARVLKVVRQNGGVATRLLHLALPEGTPGTRWKATRPEAGTARALVALG